MGEGNLDGTLGHVRWLIIKYLLIIILYKVDASLWLSFEFLSWYVGDREREGKGRLY